MAGFNAAFWFSAAIAACMVIGMGYMAAAELMNRIQSKPRPVADGFEVLDIEDHWHGSSTGPALTGLALAIMALGILLLFNISKAIDVLIAMCILLFAAIFLLTGISNLQHQKRETEKARPGRLTVSRVPVTPGNHTSFSFRRSLRPGFKPTTVEAQLRFEAGYRHGNRLEWHVYASTELPDTPLTLQGDEACATWELEIPAASPPESNNLSGGRASADLCRWALRVVIKSHEGQDLDSCFHLPFAYPVLTFTASPH